MVLSVIKAVGLCDILAHTPRRACPVGLGAVVMAGRKREGTCGWRGFQQLNCVLKHVRFDYTGCIWHKVVSKIVIFQAIIPRKYDMLKMVSSIYMQYIMASRWRQKESHVARWTKYGYHNMCPWHALTSIPLFVPCFYDPHMKNTRHLGIPGKKNRPLALQDMPGLTTGPITRHLHAKVMGLEHLGRIPFNKFDH